MIWFTSDTHFSHANAIKFTNRPFESVEAMEDGSRNWREWAQAPTQEIDDYDAS